MRRQTVPQHERGAYRSCIDRLELTTGRLRLRPLAPPAAAMLLDGDRAGAERMLGARPADDWPAAALNPVLRGQATMPLPMLRYGIWTIAELSSETIVGDIGFHGPPDDAGIVELGFSVVSSRRRQGIVSEAATAIITATIARPEITGIVARCEPDNAPSIATLRRVGFSERSRTGGMIHWTL